MSVPVTLDDIKPEPPPRCLDCGEAMKWYGGSTGWVHCNTKILHRAGGWFDDRGLHVKDDRLAGGTRRVDGEVRQRR